MAALPGPSAQHFRQHVHSASHQMCCNDMGTREHISICSEHSFKDEAIGGPLQQRQGLPVAESYGALLLPRALAKLGGRPPIRSKETFLHTLVPD